MSKRISNPSGTTIRVNRLHLSAFNSFVNGVAGRNGVPIPVRGAQRTILEAMDKAGLGSSVVWERGKVQLLAPDGTFTELHGSMKRGYITFRTLERMQRLGLLRLELANRGGVVTRRYGRGNRRYTVENVLLIAAPHQKNKGRHRGGGATWYILPDEAGLARTAISGMVRREHREKALAILHAAVAATDAQQMQLVLNEAIATGATGSAGYAPPAPAPYTNGKPVVQFVEQYNVTLKRSSGAVQSFKIGETDVQVTILDQ